MNSGRLREEFLDYFRQRGHTIIPSASLVPEGDPSLLFNIAGMVQFKQFYASKGPIPFARAASVQKCLRATDLEEVGRTIKHHTFFEMLGNFSFGDYFKEEAIEWAWDFLTRVVGLDIARLHVSVYEQDHESEKIWMERMGVPQDRIYRLGRKDNFWGPAGLTGPCGPCSEIHFDLGPDMGCGRPECSPECSCDRFVEVWNLVFPQFYHHEDGRLSPLERQGVDTGMGLERLAMVAQGVRSTYQTDLLKPLVDFVKAEAGIDPRDQSKDLAVRVISDHARALCFAISEGVLPSNEGRGYVVRRILRRAVVKALDLGIREAFLFKAVGRAIDVMSQAYPELAENHEKIALIVRSDEERFEKTILRGMAMLKESLEDLTARGQKVLPGEVVFKLYDTYGFPVEITRELAGSRRFEIDGEGFEREMESQRARARQASKLGTELDSAGEMDQAPDAFVGYDTLEVPSLVAALAIEGAAVQSVSEGDRADMELERTPFYPQGGGQVSDVGVVTGGNGRAGVEAVSWAGGNHIRHRILVERGSLSVGEGVVAKVDVAKRRATQRNHTATHLLHAALRSVLGGHVRQSGSLVAADRLRFDFTHYEPLSDAEIDEIEDQVNQRILDDISVRSSVELYEKAREKGALALFGEKYGRQVRVIEIEDTSCELCGGTHVRSTGEIGGFRIVSESGIAAGVRRIEALTGLGVIEAGREAARQLQRVSAVLRVPLQGLEDGARKTVERVKALEKETSMLRGRLAGAEVDEILKGVSHIEGIDLVASRVEASSIELLKHLADRVKEKLPRGVVCLGSTAQDRVFLVVGVAPELVRERGIKASMIAKKLGEMVGGKGGGKETFAQAGGKNTSMLDSALQRCAGVVAGLAK